VIVSRVIYVNLRVAPRGSGLCEVRAVNTIIRALFQQRRTGGGRNDTTMLTHGTRARGNAHVTHTRKRDRRTRYQETGTISASGTSERDANDEKSHSRASRTTRSESARRETDRHRDIMRRVGDRESRPRHATACPASLAISSDNGSTNGHERRYTWNEDPARGGSRRMDARGSREIPAAVINSRNDTVRLAFYAT